MKTFQFILLLLLTLSFLSCKKPEASAPVINLETDGKIEYRYKFTGLYTGTYTNWWFSQGITTTSSTENYSASVTMDKTQDSVIHISNFGSFTVTAQGSGSLAVGWKVYKQVKLQNDSLYFYFNDLSALGGSYGYYLKAKKEGH